MQNNSPVQVAIGSQDLRPFHRHSPLSLSSSTKQSCPHCLPVSEYQMPEAFVESKSVFSSSEVKMQNNKLEWL